MERTIVSSPAANAEDDIDEVQEYLNQSANTAAAQVGLIYAFYNSRLQNSLLIK
jgi:hypothetical protein